MTSIADIISTVLQIPGQIMRDIVLAIPMPLARGIFIAYFLTLLVWVMLLPKEEAQFQPSEGGQVRSLKPMTAVSLAIIIGIYLYFGPPLFGGE